MPQIQRELATQLLLVASVVIIPRMETIVPAGLRHSDDGARKAWSRHGAVSTSGTGDGPVHDPSRDDQGIAAGHEHERDRNQMTRQHDRDC